MKKTIAFTTLFLLLNLAGGLIFLQSCETDDGCGSFDEHKFERVESDYYRILLLDGTLAHRQTLHSDQISYDSLTIQLLFYSSPIAQNREAFGMNLLLACSPPIPAFTPKQIKVTSTASFDSTHPPGEDLSDIFSLALTHMWSLRP